MASTCVFLLIVVWDFDLSLDFDVGCLFFNWILISDCDLGFNAGFEICDLGF